MAKRKKKKVKKPAKRKRKKNVKAPKDQATNKRTPEGRFRKGNTEGPRWSPGESGNPDGRPPGPCLKTALRKLMNEPDRARRFVEACETHALMGNAAYAKEIWERLHGKETTRVDLTSGGDKIKGYIGVSPDDWDEEGEKEDGEFNGSDRGKNQAEKA